MSDFMWDLVRCTPAMEPQANVESNQYIDVRNAGASFFLSVNSVEQARSAAKRTKYLHFPTYEADIGMVRTMAENECALVIAVSDFLDPNAATVAQRLGRARQLIFLALHFGCAVRVVTLARDDMDLRGEHELAAIGMLLGMTEQQMRAQMNEKMPAGAPMMKPAQVSAAHSKTPAPKIGGRHA